jgi:L-aminopeptidase/D-esterase-like protein
MVDGDTIFALSTGNRKVDVTIVGTFAAEVFARAILRAVLAAKPAAGLPTASSMV